MSKQFWKMSKNKTYHFEVIGDSIKVTTFPCV